jgi:hypothetical protein
LTDACVPPPCVAAWYYLLADVHGFKKGGFVSVLQLADKHGDGDWTNGTSAAYLKGWKKHLPSPGTDAYHLANDKEMMVLAKAMFAHELGHGSPLSEAQILYGIKRERAGTMPP